MTECPHCRGLWERQGEVGAEAVHPLCLASHMPQAPLKVGPGPVTGFGWLTTSGPPVAFARGPAPAVARPVLIDATGTDPDPDTAAAKAVAELLERQTTYLRPRAPIQLRPDTTRASWQVEARLLPSGEAFALPVEHIALPVPKPLQASGGASPSGMAVGPTSRRVIEFAVLEAAERAGLASMDGGGPSWRIADLDPADPYVEAVGRDGWDVDVVGTGYADLSVAACIATSGDWCVLGAAAAVTPRLAAGKALSEAYMKTVGVRVGNCATVPSLARSTLVGLWPELPAPPALAPDDRSPLDLVYGSGALMAMVDRGNALLDAMGWRAAQVVVVDPPRSVRAPFSGLL